MDSPIKPVEIMTPYVPLDKVDQEHQERRRRKGRHRDSGLDDTVLANESEAPVTAELSALNETDKESDSEAKEDRATEKPKAKRDDDEHIDLTA